MIINDKGRVIIMDAEGLRLTAYKCPAGVLTIGYGSTGPHVLPGMKITRREAEEFLEHDLQRFEHGVGDMAPRCTGPQFSALVSFAFNVGLNALGKSTLLKHHTAGRYLSAAEEFLKWTKAGGVVLPGLVKRRHAERALYLQPEN